MPIDRFQRNHGQFGEKSRFLLYVLGAISIERIDLKFTNDRNIAKTRSRSYLRIPPDLREHPNYLITLIVTVCF